MKKLNAEHGIVCRLPGKKLGYFGWPTVARLDDGPDGDLGYPSTVELDDSSLFSVCYQKVPGDKKCSLLWSHWQLPK